MEAPSVHRLLSQAAGRTYGNETSMDSLAPVPGQVTEDELAKHEAGINRVAWAGGVAVTIVTVLLLVFLFSRAESAWEYPIYVLLAGIPLAYGAFCNFILRGFQVTLLHRYQAQLHIKVSELEEMAARDELTGLYNRRHFYHEIQRELAKAKSTKEPLALLLLDLDGLKAINDEHGHSVGDVIIANLGKIIVKHSRNSDTGARLGGDEYGIIMPATDKRGAFSMARRLWEELEQTPMYEHDGKYLMVTVSIGVSGYPWGGEDLEEMIHWADSDMYANKVSRKLPDQPRPRDWKAEIDSLPDDFAAGI
jgi:diguanylate cyclase (GGDEF)-like protein